jgi:hypothetical protein
MEMMMCMVKEIVMMVVAICGDDIGVGDRDEWIRGVIKYEMKSRRKNHFDRKNEFEKH